MRGDKWENDGELTLSMKVKGDSQENGSPFPIVSKKKKKNIETLSNLLKINLYSESQAGNIP